MVRMKFPRDTYYNQKLVALAGKEVDIEDSMVDRWKKRGAIVVQGDEQLPSGDDKKRGNTGRKSNGK